MMDSCTASETANTTNDCHQDPHGDQDRESGIGSSKGDGTGTTSGDGPNSTAGSGSGSNYGSYYMGSKPPTNFTFHVGKDNRVEFFPPQQWVNK